MEMLRARPLFGFTLLRSIINDSLPLYAVVTKQKVVFFFSFLLVNYLVNNNLRDQTEELSLNTSKKENRYIIQWCMIFLINNIGFCPELEILKFEQTRCSDPPIVQ